MPHGASGPLWSEAVEDRDSVKRRQWCALADRFRTRRVRKAEWPSPTFRRSLWSEAVEDRDSVKRRQWCGRSDSNRHIRKDGGF